MTPARARLASPQSWGWAPLPGTSGRPRQVALCSLTAIVFVKAEVAQTPELPNVSPTSTE